jgi:hypothetical protein
MEDMLKVFVQGVCVSSLSLILLSACSSGTTGSNPIVIKAEEKPTSIVVTDTPVPIGDADSAVNPTPSDIPLTATQDPSATPEPTSKPSWIGPEDFPEGVNPLTGLEVDDPSSLERRPVLLKVSNYPSSLRPHSGLSYADMVFSYFIGVGMTRYLALYYGQDVDQVGPMRSGRLIDPQIVNLYGGFLGMVGADKTVWAEIAQMLPGRFLTEMPVNCPALCNDGYGNAFGNTGAFTERVRELDLDDQRPDLSGMIFDTQVPENGVKAKSLWLYISYYNQVGWDYEPDTGAYLRSQEETQSDGTVVLKPMTDRLTGEQLAFHNVVILFAWHKTIQPELIDIEIQSVEGGRAFLFRDGQVFEMTYTAVSPSTPLRFYDLNGEPIAFKPGNTWVEIVGLGSTVEDLGSDAWKVRFYP